MQAELIDTGALTRSIEAVLFVASEALSIKALAKLTGAEEADVSLALARIDAEYAERGIVLREIAGGYRFASAPAARSAVEAYLMPPKTNLSPAALETLAIVAYLQPVTKADIEGIRGVSADSVLSTLVDRRFLAEAGRKEVAGRPILYRTTPEFLEAFGLRSLEELPVVDIDSAAPVELVLPIPTQAVPGAEEPKSQGDPAPDAAAGIDPQPEPAEASAAVDESENVLAP
ncbi:MAG: SMC-Scp complex subunit ScpB [Candidatus Velthaea sp.]|jgi:segregation and condensation protein B